MCWRHYSSSCSSCSCSRAEEELLADLLGVEVLLDQEVDDDGELLIDEVLAVLLHADQDVASAVQDVGDLWNKSKLIISV